jgi:uncharacterized protein YcbK (DUF882 family)
VNGDRYEAGLVDPPSPFVAREQAESELGTEALVEHEFDHEDFDHEDLGVDQGEEAWLGPQESTEAEPEWLSEDESGVAEFEELGEVLELEQEDPTVVGRIRDAVTAGMWSAALQLSIAAGQRDENVLTNLVFRTRHPELGGRPIRRDERALAAEWVSIRDTLVRPALRGPSGARAATGTSTQRLTTRTLREAWASSRCNDADMVTVEFLGRRTPINRVARDAYEALAQALESTGYRAKSAWSYNCRKIRNSENWSLHAYGLAIDIDPSCNPHRVGNPAPARFSAAATQDERCADVHANRADTNFTREQIAAAESIRTVDGLRVFSWAGHWRRSPDAMHFQIDVTPGELRRGLEHSGGPRTPTVRGRAHESAGSFADEVFQPDHESDLAVATQSEAPAPVWLAEAMANADFADEEQELQGGTTAPGSFEVEHLPMLASHRGTKPDLVLRWNGMANPSAIDVVIHFHGYSGDRQRMHLPTSKAPRSGLDLVDPPSGGPGRPRPTLAILPRGNYFGGRSGIGYNFPALTPPGALRALIREAMQLFANRTGVRAPVGRMILTGHSGGGAPIMAILRHEDPDEVHTFDALYGHPAALIVWARKRIERDLAQGTLDGALRVIYRGGEPTDANSQRVRRALCPMLARAGNSALSARYRVERTRVPHNDVPLRFGGALLADAGADVPGLVRYVCSPAPRREAESWEQGEPGAEWAAEEEESTEMSVPRERASDEDEAWEASADEWEEDAHAHESEQHEDAHESIEQTHVHEFEDGEAPDTELVAATAAYEALSTAMEISDLDRARRQWEAEDEEGADAALAADASAEYEVLSAAFEAADVVRASPGFEEAHAHHAHGLVEGQEYDAFEAADIAGEETGYELEEAMDEETVESGEVEVGEAEAFLDDLYSREVVLESETSATVTFPSGATLRTVSGPTAKGQEHFDPWASGNPLLETSASVRATLLSANFTVGELTRSGGVYFDKARIDPNLVRCLQKLRDHIGKPVQITSSYRPYGYNDKLYKEKYKKDPTQSRHSSGQAVDIRIAGMTGMEIAKTAIDVCGTTLGVGIANTFAHIDVRPTWGRWTYFGEGTEENRRAIAEIDAYRNQRLGGGAARPPAATPARDVGPPPGVATQMVEALGRGLWDTAVRIAMGVGITDANRLTNMLFYLRHPELRGKRIAPEQHDLAREWIEIRDRWVTPALKDAPATTSPSPAPGARGSRELDR